MSSATNTTKLSLPYLAAAQAQKHVTHNEALKMLDDLLYLSLESRNMAAPPASASEGQAYLIAANATGSWAGHSGEIVAFHDGGWEYYPANAGYVAYIQAEDTLIYYDGSAWKAIGIDLAQGVQNLTLLGVNATANLPNRLTVSAPAALFTHEGADMQVKINKATPEKTASLLFQDNWQGRAEIGLTGDDDFHVKTSPDGTAWVEAIEIDKTTGFVNFPQGSSAHLAGFRNKLINGGFTINQRGYASGTILAAGTYGHDRWKAGAAGCTYTFVGNAPHIEISISQGSLLQIIEGSSIEGGNYMISWQGTAQGRVNGGAYAASPLSVAGIPEGQNLSIEFGTGTLSFVQCEAGRFVTRFEARPFVFELDLCTRYYAKSFDYAIKPANGIANDIYAGFSFQDAYVLGQRIHFPKEMRQIPNVTFFSSSFAPATANSWCIFDMNPGFIISAAQSTICAASFRLNSKMVQPQLNMVAGQVVHKSAYMVSGGWSAEAEL